MFRRTLPPSIAMLVVGALLVVGVGAGCKSEPTVSEQPDASPDETAIVTTVNHPAGEWTIPLPQGYLLARAPVFDPETRGFVFDLTPSSESGFQVEVLVYPAATATSIENIYLPIAQEAQRSGCTTCVPLWDTIAGQKTYIFDTGSIDYRYYVSVRSRYVLEVKAGEGHYEAAHRIMEGFRATEK